MDTPRLTTITPGMERSSAATCTSDIEGFYYEWNGSYHRIVKDDKYVCLANGMTLSGLGALVSAAAAIMLSF